jgi:signal transduction histidine kinase
VNRHSLLERQIRRHLGDEDAIPAAWRAFLDAVDDAYRQSDCDRARLERSLHLGAQELLQANSELRVLKEAEKTLVYAEEERARLQVMGALGHLVGGLAHEVRNPLFAISATIEAMLSSLDQMPQHAELRRCLENLREPTERLSELMSELLEYGKPLGRDLAAGSLDDVLRQAVDDCAQLAAARQVELSLRLGTRQVAVGMIRRRLLMALHNLIQNALQHTPPGGTVTVELQEVAEEGAAWVRCRFLDSGSGFRPGDLPRIFEPFVSRRRGGTGLGLSIVQRVAEEHRARIVAANRPEGGAVVTLDLPRQRL